MTARQIVIHIFAAVILPLAAFAQDEAPTKVNNQNRAGDLPFTASVGTSIESVNLATGNLSVTVPIASIPGRGMPFNLALRYDSLFWVAAKRKTPQGVDYHRWNIERAPYEPDMSTGLGWRTNYPKLDTTTQMFSCLGGPGGGKSRTIFTDASGAKHPIAATSGADCLGYYSFDHPAGPDTGGSGIWHELHSSTVKLSDGTKIAGVWYTDPNGNQKSDTPGQMDTLGRIPVTRQNLTNSFLLKVYDSGGVQRTYTLNYGSFSISSGFGVSGPYGPIQEFGATRKLITSIVLPNGRSYGFTYYTHGGISQINLPTGATVAYQWSIFSNGEFSHRYISRRTVTVNGSVQVWNISRSACLLGGINGCTKYETTVTDPDGNQTVYTVVHGTVERAQIKNSAGQLLRQYDVEYTNHPAIEQSDTGARVPTRVTTTLETGQVSKVEYDYDQITYDYTECDEEGLSCYTTTNIPTTRGNVTQIREYDWGQGAPGALVRKTTKSYLHTGNSNYISRNIVDKVTEEVVYDGLNAMAAKTHIQYDNYTGNTLLTQSGVPQHDYTNYPTSMIYRGNPTHVTRWKNASTPLPPTVYQYDELGNIRKITDPEGHLTQWSYSDSWANSSCLPPSNSHAYVSQVTNHLGHRLQLTRYPCTGLVQARKDENDILASRAGTTFTYDLLNRLLTKTDVLGGQVSNSYADVPPVTVTTTVKITSTLNHVSEVELDGLGRTKQTRLLSDPQGTVLTDVTYDALGRKATESNSYRGTPPNEFTTYRYDPLGRTTEVIPPDGSLATPCTNCIRTFYVGNTTEVKDQAGNGRWSETDALGRLIRVKEPQSNGVYGYSTRYHYDTLGNLTCVIQHVYWSEPTDCASSPAQYRPRSFTYDWLSQLQTANNPESGLISYTYKNDGLLWTKTDARGITITYAYDGLHRLTGKTYSNGDPAVSYLYDQTSYNGLTITNGKGRRTGMSDASGAAAWTYDPVGRPTVERRTIGTSTKSISYAYNLNGSLYRLTYPSGSLVDYAYNGAGRTASAVEPTLGINFAVEAAYAPHGALTSLKHGKTASFAGITVTNSYNKRLQPIDLSAAAPAGTVMSLTYNFHLGVENNGNVYAITDNLDDPNHPTRPINSRTFTYNQLNWLVGAETTGTDCTVLPNGLTRNWGLSWLGQIDIWGNIWNQNVTKCSAQGFSYSANSKNQLDQFTYDAAGNQLTAGGQTFTYDAENRMKTASGYTYTYDGDGRRVKKSTGSTGTLYWQDLGGNVIQETDLTGNTYFNRFVFFNGQRIARRDANGAVRYYFADHLGTTAVITNETGGLVEESHFYPYGGERVVLDNDPNPYKFTGKERDTESGLDYFGARYYSSNIGRFTTADPKIMSKQRLLDPQQWNMYSYVRNNPLIFVDPDGRELTIYVKNNTTYGDNVAQQIGEKAASRFREAKVKNVTVKVVDKLPTKEEVKNNPHVASVELISHGNKNIIRDGETGFLNKGSPGQNFDKNGTSLVDATYHVKPGQSNEDVVQDAGSDTQHEVAHRYLDHSTDPNSPMQLTEEPINKPFTDAEAKVLQEKLNKPGELEQKQPKEGTKN